MIEISDDLRDIVISALRYALYRHTYMLDLTCDFIKNNSRMFNERMLNVMLRDIEKRLEDHDLKDFERASIEELKNFLESYKA